MGGSFELPPFCFGVKICQYFFDKLGVVYDRSVKRVILKGNKMKYEFTGEELNRLKRIRRLRDGLIGGWIESDRNLSQDGECFIYDNAKVFGDARVSCNAQVSESARVFGNALVHGNAEVFGNAHVYSYARVSGNARVYSYANVSGTAEISDGAQVFGYAKVSGNTWVSGDATVSELGDYWSISGFRYAITYTKSNDSLRIGCHLHTVGEWKSMETYPKDCPEIESFLKQHFGG